MSVGVGGAVTERTALMFNAVKVNVMILIGYGDVCVMDWLWRYKVVRLM